VETYVGAQFRGVVGAVIVLGAELGSATGQTFINPNTLAGITVGAGILIVFGPSAIIPAVAAGTGAALLVDIRSRPMNGQKVNRTNLCQYSEPRARRLFRCCLFLSPCGPSTPSHRGAIA
jgi:hypothetical protein